MTSAISYELEDRRNVLWKLDLTSFPLQCAFKGNDSVNSDFGLFHLVAWKQCHFQSFPDSEGRISRQDGSVECSVWDIMFNLDLFRLLEAQENNLNF